MLKASPICDYHKILKGFCTDFYIVYMEQKLSGLQSGSQSRCTCLHRTFVVQYNKACHIVVHCSVIVTL